MRRLPRLLRHRSVVVLFAFAAALAGGPVAASFHLMQIEQVIGGVCGHVESQAIQLRMRAFGQNLVSGRQLWAWDSTGANPVLLLTFPANVSGTAAGSRILATTAAFTSGSNGPAPDFSLSQPIPAAYLAAGKLTFEDGIGNVYWGLAWGGASFTGTNMGTLDNDADGNFSPPFAGKLDWGTGRSLRFTGVAGAQSTSNAADYAMTLVEATFANNAGGAGLVTSCLFGDGFETGAFQGWDLVSQP